MANFSHWERGDGGDPTRLMLYFLVSRGKDNRELAGFQRRYETFLAYEGSAMVERRFDTFVRAGLIGERSRLYQSVNARDEPKVRTALLAYLIEHDWPIAHLDSLSARLAAQKDKAAESRWLLDIDTTDEPARATILEEFERAYADHYQLVVTPNGLAIVTEHGFDSRELLRKYGDVVSVKRDALLFVEMRERF